ncbi:hypothetical protein K505DRAFT_255648 [Melanomma pulvis-pyrius CBS 109.77]|uniref:BTB domain-containing protein n=1 Tax=Melanomma pulvis-pyrius CBS 109.77 TaxID=1314802 RepID=A0A6A6WWU6_9PLEO|nr:hypothetical protein K505DRAFT_255648 [Melanomma pulvis-pyrius CBS 109.77]
MLSIPNPKENYADDHSFTGKTIEVRVKDETFHIHQSIICKTSEFFKNAVKLEWAGVKKKPIDLRNESKDTFNVYLGWLYSKSLYHISHLSSTWTKLTEAYVIGEKLMDQSFQVAVMDAMIGHRTNHTQWFPSIENINTIYDGTVEASPARRLMVDLCVWRDGSPWTNKELLGKVHDDFVDDLLLALLEQRKPPATKSHAPWMDPQAYRRSK